MPVFSCGGMRFQYKWQDRSPDEIPSGNQLNLEATVKRALELGINHFETARGYGTSEMQLGQILPKINRDRFLIQTKVAPKSDIKEFEERFQLSYDYLGLDYLDLFTLHGINNQDIFDWMVKGGCLDKALQLKKEGRVRFLGFSTHAPTELTLKILDLGVFDYINFHWYFVNPYTRPILERAQKMDLGVLIISPNDKGGKLYNPPEKLVKLCEPFSPMVFNDLYCLSNPAVHTLSIGAARPSDFDEHLKSLDNLEQASEWVKPIEEKLMTEIQKQFAQDWMDVWPLGIPHFSDVPGEVNLFEILRLWTFGKGLDLWEFAKARYNMLSTNSIWFPGNNAGTLHLEGLSDLLGKHPYRDWILEMLKEAHQKLYDPVLHQKNMNG